MSDDQPGQAGAQRPAFDLKGTVLSVTVLRLRSCDVAQIERDLTERTAQLPRFFAGAPVVIDCAALQGAPLDFAALVVALRRCGVVPVGVRSAGAASEVAVAAGLGVLEDSPTRAAPRPRAASEAQDSATEASASPAEPQRQPTLVVKKPVRSGRVVHASRSDLLLLAPVNAGAEVIADGHVHAYAPLRGRVLAGANGDEDARIFASQMSAELVSVAGHYLRADQIPEDLRGKPAQVQLKDGLLVILPL